MTLLKNLPEDQQKELRKMIEEHLELSEKELKIIQDLRTKLFKKGKYLIHKIEITKLTLRSRCPIQSFTKTFYPVKKVKNNDRVEEY